MAAIFKMAALKDYISQFANPNFTALTVFMFLVPMSMFKNPLNLNFHFRFIMADKMAAIFKMAAIEGLNYSFLPYTSLH